MERHAQRLEVLHIPREQRQTVMRRGCSDDDVREARRATEGARHVREVSGRARDFDIERKNPVSIEVQNCFEPSFKRAKRESW